MRRIREGGEDEAGGELGKGRKDKEDETDKRATYNPVVTTYISISDIIVGPAAVIYLPRIAQLMRVYINMHAAQMFCALGKHSGLSEYIQAQRSPKLNLLDAGHVSEGRKTVSHSFK